MLAFLGNSTKYKRLSYLAALVLGLSSCEQQKALPVSTTPIPSSPAQPDRYYVNARISTKEVVEQLDPKTITRTDVLRGQQAADYAHDASIKGVISVQTR
jgi:hypothetical protein